MRNSPTIDRVMDKDFKSDQPDDQTIRDIVNLGDNISKLYTVEDLPLLTIHHTYPYIQSTIHATLKNVEVKITDDSGFIDRLFLFDNKKTFQIVRVISQQTSFETRLILLLNEHLAQYQNSNYHVRNITPNMAAIINEIVRDRLCQS